MKFLILSLVTNCFFFHKGKEENPKKTFTQDFCSFFRLDLPEFPYFYFVCFTVQNFTSTKALLDIKSDYLQSFALTTNFVALPHYEGKPLFPSRKVVKLVNEYASGRSLEVFTFQVLSKVMNTTIFLQNIDLREKQETHDSLDFLFPQFAGFYSSFSLNFDKNKNVTYEFFIVNQSTGSHESGVLVTNQQATELVKKYRDFLEEGVSTVFSDHS